MNKNIMFCALVLLLLASCTPIPVQKEEWVNFDGLSGKIISVEGCQYIKICSASYSLTHKGNCTNCWARLEVLLSKKRNTNVHLLLEKER